MSCGTVWNLAIHFVAPDQLSPACQLVLSQKWLPDEFDPLIYGLYFGSTLLLELPIYLLFLRRRVGGGFQTKWLLDVLILNLLTHPFVVLGLPLMIVNSSYALYLTCAETIAVLVEATYLRLRGYPLRWSLGVSLAANLFSWHAGRYLIDLVYSLAL